MDQTRKANTWVLAYEFLQDQIVKGVLNPGEKINEREISDQLHISRTPIREALKKLEYEGFVINAPKKGVYVKKYPSGELDAIHRMLVRLEGLAVVMAAPKLTKKDVRELHQINNKLKKLASKNNYLNYLTFNNSGFHLFFAKKSGSEELFNLISQLRKRILRLSYTQITMLHDPLKYLKDHDDIIDALEGKTQKKPPKLMEAHIERARKSFIDFYQKFAI